MDIELLAEGIIGVFRTYGFGAKTSLGYGTANEKFKAPFRFEIRCNEKLPLVPQPEYEKKRQVVVRDLKDLALSSGRTQGQGEEKVGFEELRNYLKTVATLFAEERKRRQENSDAP
jgi:hypothetical protein